MQLIICDNKNINIESSESVIYTDNIKPCIGCFNCWCKGKCIFKDSNIKELIEKADKIVLITKNVYGSISAPIKRLFDRSISSVQPFFTFRNGLMRHKLKKNHIHKDLEVYLYGNSTHNEKVTLKNMLQSLCENLGATLQNIYYKPNLTKVTI